MIITQNIIPKNRDNRPGFAMMPEYITIHDTANPNATAIAHGNYLAKNSIAERLPVSWHFTVDNKDIVQHLPLNESGYHAGDGNGPGNRKSIGIEICESGNRQKTLDNAVKLVAKMLKERKWGVDKLRRHYDWSGKICPRIMQPNNWAGWSEFKQDVQKKLSGGGVMENKNTPDDWAKKDWEWAKEKGWLDGTRPKDNLTRQEFAIVIRRLVERK